jgi:uncharacterized membrane protein
LPIAGGLALTNIALTRLRWHLGLVSGAAASLFRKGSRRHTLAGKVFVASMLTMALGATWLGIQKHESGNIGGGILTFYMILTAWLTARRRWRDNEQI